MLRAYRNWDFPKGLVEPGEAPIDAALREVREETGLTNLQFDWGQDFVETGPYNRGKIARYYLARSDETEVRLLVNPELGFPEHHESRWVKLDAARRDGIGAAVARDQLGRIENQPRLMVPRPISTTSPPTKISRSAVTSRNSQEGRSAISPCEILS